MIRAIIIDDEEHCRERLTNLLSEFPSSEILLMGEFSNVEDGTKAIKKLKPDLVFLDVQIHELTGFDLLSSLDSIDFEVVFTTAYERFAVQAFKFSAFDYLLKPIDRDELAATISKLTDKLERTMNESKVSALLQNVKYSNGNSGRISVPTLNGLIMLETEKIIRCESDVNYTTIYPEGEKKITVAKTLKEFEELLENRGFYRLHNSHLVNLAYIKAYNKGKGGSVILKDNTEIEVSTRRKEELLMKLAGLNL